MINSLITPCTLTAPQRQHSRRARRNHKTPMILTSYALGKPSIFSVSEHPSPHKIINFHHTSLIASDLGHIAHLFRRFHGGGSNGFSPTIDARNYSDNFSWHPNVRENSPDAIRRPTVRGTAPRFAMHIYFCASIATMRPSRRPNSRAKYVALTAQIVRMHRAREPWLYGDHGQQMRSAGEHDTVQMTGPHFRPKLGAMGIRPPSREPSPAADSRPRTAFERCGSHQPLRNSTS